MRKVRRLNPGLRVTTERPRALVLRIARCSLLLLSLCLCVSVAPLPALAQGPNEAAVIVDFGDGRVESFCVAFTEGSITGAELLSRTGLELVMGTSSVGQGVCKIGDTGCGPGQNCFCQCQGVDCRYWSYFQWQDGAWVYSPVGGGQRQVAAGDADAWMWSDGKSLPQVSPLGVCGDAAGESAPAVTPVAEVTAAPVDTAAPTETPSPDPSATASGAAAGPTEVVAATATAEPASPTATQTPVITLAKTTAATPGATEVVATVAPAATTMPSAESGSCLGGVLGWLALVAMTGVAAVAIVRRG